MASTLEDVLNSPDRKSTVIRDCMDILEAEVADKSGLSGLAIKAGYGAVKGIKPGFVERVVTDLLPEFARAVTPIYDEARAQARPVRQHFMAHSGRVADSLLAITDGKAQRSKNNVVKKTYERLRGSAKRNVESAVPRLGELIERHTASAGA